MHVLIIPSWYQHFPGDVSGVFFREQALALKDYGNKVGLIYPQLTSLRGLTVSSVLSTRLDSINDSGVNTVRAYGFLWIPRSKLVARRIWVRKGLQAFHKYVSQHGKPDVIHAHSILNAAVLAREISEKENIPYVITEHFTGYARGILSKSELRLASRVADGASELLAVSKPFCLLLDQVLSNGKEQWKEMPNLVEQRFLEKPLNLNGGDEGAPFTFINVSILDPKKGVHHLIEAFSRAFPDDQSVKLEIGGDGDERNRLEELAKRLGVSDRVIFLGRLERSQVLEYMSHANALVVASSYETFGVVVIEALALGKPVIATRCGGPESILTDGDGLIVPPSDVGQLINALKFMRENIKRYSSSQIREQCASRYSAESVSKKLTTLYQNVVSKWQE